MKSRKPTRQDAASSVQRKTKAPGKTNRAHARYANVPARVVVQKQGSSTGPDTADDSAPAECGVPEVVGDGETNESPETGFEESSSADATASAEVEEVSEPADESSPAATGDQSAEPVQMKAAGGSETESTHEAAAGGVAGAGDRLPHLGEIQASFGRHDVSGVKAHTDRAAVEATQTIGAEAYATGTDIAFSRSPDLHTAAHEAAHVVQQRGGVQLRGGVGSAGDAYEKNADAAADLVVQGKSSEAILDAFSDPGRAPAAAPTIQRKRPEKFTKTDNAKLVKLRLRLAAKEARAGVLHWKSSADAEILNATGLRAASHLRQVNRSLEGPGGVGAEVKKLTRELDLAYGACLRLLAAANESDGAGVLRLRPGGVEFLHAFLDQLSSHAQKHGWTQPATLKAANKRSAGATRRGAKAKLSPGDEKALIKLTLKLTRHRLRQEAKTKKEASAIADEVGEDLGRADLLIRGGFAAAKDRAVFAADVESTSAASSAFGQKCATLGGVPALVSMRKTETRLRKLVGLGAKGSGVATAARNANKMKAITNIGQLERTIGVKVREWRMAARSVGSGYETAGGRHKLACDNAAKEKALHQAIIFGLLTAATAGALSWMSTVAQAGFSASKELLNVLEDTVQSGLGEGLDVLQAKVAPSGKPVSSGPLGYQNNLLNHIDDLHNKVTEYFIDVVSRIVKAPPIAWDASDSARQLEKHDAWLKKSRLSKAPKVAAAKKIADSLETDMWAKWAPRLIKKEITVGTVGFGRDIITDPGSPVEKRLNKLGITKAAGIGKDFGIITFDGDVRKLRSWALSHKPKKLLDL